MQKKILNIRGAQLSVQDSHANQHSHNNGLNSGSVLPAFLWGHCLIGSMNQDDDAALLHWRELAKKTRLIRYDVRGHGQSKPCRLKQSFQFSELKQDIIALADRLDLNRFALGGVSLGSALALHVAVTAPERISALVLIAPPTAWEMRAKQAVMYRRVAAGIRLGGLIPLQLIGALSRFRGGVDNIPMDGLPASILARSTVQHAGALDRRSAVAAFMGAAASDLPSLEELKKIQQPVLILGWHKDSSHPAAIAERLQQALPNSELHFADHMGDMKRWTVRVQSFLAKHP